MKCAIFFACLALASAVPTKKTTKDLTASLDEILGIVNFSGFVELVAGQIETDADMQRLAAILSGDEFVAMIVEVEASEGFQNFLQFNVEQGVDLYAYLQPVLDLFGWPGPSGKAIKAAAPSKTYADLIATWSAFFEPASADALDWLFTAIQIDESVQALLVYLQSQEFQDLVQFVRDQAATANLVAELEAEGLDVSGTFALVAEFLGWDLPAY